MAKYDQRPECQLNQEIEEIMDIFSYLSQWEQAGEKMPHRDIQQAIERGKQNASKLVALKKFNEELLSVAEEQYLLFEVCAQSISTDSESEAEEQEIKSNPTTAGAEIATALLKSNF